MPPNRKDAVAFIRLKRVWTPEGGREWPAGTDAVLCEGSRITFVGKTDDVEGLLQQRGMEGVKIFDCKGKYFLSPGFIDAHIHLIDSGKRMGWLDLHGITGREDFRSRLSKYLEENKEVLGTDGWVRGGGWNEAEMNGQSPNREWIDDLTKDRAVLLSRSDLHSALANSFALNMAGVTKDSWDPPGGRTDKDMKGEPTGVLRERAQNLVKDHAPKKDSDLNVAMALERAQEVLFREGITQVHTMSSIDFETTPELEQLSELDEKGLLKLRVVGAVRLNNWEDGVRLREMQIKKNETLPASRTPHLHFGACKCFLDGSLGSRTLAMLEPLLGQDVPVNGLLMEPINDVAFRALKATEENLQLCFHAIGDLAVRHCIDIARACAQVVQKGGLGPRKKVRIEHCQHIHPEDIPRMAELNMVASMQPLQLTGDTCDCDSLLGPERSKLGAFAFKSLRNAGVRVAFGSDWMVCYPDAVETLYIATERKAMETNVPWHPEQALTMEEALYAQTYAGAETVDLEGEIGRVEPGFLADLTILADDPFIADRSTLAAFREQCHVVGTVVDGHVHYWKE